MVNKKTILIDQASSTNILKDLALDAGIKIKLASNEPILWKNVLTKCPYIPTFYALDIIEYQLAYIEEANKICVDISCIIFWGDEPAALWPLTLTEFNSNVNISSQGQPIMQPLISSSIAVSAQRNIAKLCLDILTKLTDHYKIEKISFIDSFNNQLGLNEWNFQLSQSGLACKIHYDLFLQINSSIDQIMGGFRKKLRYEINQSKKLWNSSVLSANSSDKEINEAWNEFKNLHYEVSGKLTRSNKSWEIQKKSLTESHAILVILRDDFKRMIGGGYFTFTRDEALYAVAAYDRSLFNHPVGHLVQYIAIEEFTKQDIKWYRLGRRPHDGESPQPSKKEFDIGKFKKQFSSHIFPSYEFKPH